MSALALKTSIHNPGSRCQRACVFFIPVHAGNPHWDGRLPWQGKEISKMQVWHGRHGLLPSLSWPRGQQGWQGWPGCHDMSSVA